MLHRHTLTLATRGTILPFCTDICSVVPTAAAGLELHFGSLMASKLSEHLLLSADDYEDSTCGNHDLDFQSGPEGYVRLSCCSVEKVTS